MEFNGSILNKPPRSQAIEGKLGAVYEFGPTINHVSMSTTDWFKPLSEMPWIKGEFFQCGKPFGIEGCNSFQNSAGG